MKHFTLILVAILITSCCSSKQVVSSTPEIVKVKETTKPEIEVEEINPEIITPEVVEAKIPLPPKPPKLKNNRTENFKPEAFNHNRWNTLLQKNVSETGQVNYKAFKNNKTELHIYIDSLSENMPAENWTKEDKLAYWINAYNAMTVDLILRNQPLKSIKDIKEPWKLRLWKLGKKWYNLDEIEHQILRKMNEPRIHFAIVCASFSCPKLQNEAFVASNLDAQLTKVTQEFLTDSNRNNITKSNLKLSKIFKWFKKDFETNGSLINFLNTYSKVQISPKAKKSFKDYNWNLND